MSEKVITITDSSFENEVMNNSGITLLYFKAVWCAPCTKQSTIMEKFAEKHEDKFKVCKIDADENKETVSKFKVRGLPTVLLFKDGSSIASKVGLVNLDTLEDFVKQNV